LLAKKKKKEKASKDRRNLVRFLRNRMFGDAGGAVISIESCCKTKTKSCATRKSV
jgi:hypothetical protein